MTMFDGTYPIPQGDRHADNTDHACAIGKRDKEVVILPPSQFRWEDNPLPIPTPAELDADDLPFAHEVR